MSLMVFAATSATAQKRVKRNLKPIKADTTKVVVKDTLSSDSVKRKKDAITAPVYYEATDSIVFLGTGYANLYGQGKLNYETIELKANVISLNIDSTSVFAHGVKDSITDEIQGKPVFKEGETPYETDEIRYNFNSRRGLISDIITQQGEGYVTGKNAKKGKDDELYLRDGKYTTCDQHDHPHFYMQMTYAKVRPKKNVVMGPAYLVVEDVPLPIALPFFFFPFSSSYSSGFLMPTYMDDSYRGFGLVGGGYYFAISDKMDLQLTGDLFTKGSWSLNAQTNYVKRYKYSGLLQANYQITKTGDKGVDQTVAKDFKIVWSHRQDPKANPNRDFSASVNFSTSSYERTNIGNLYNAQAMSQNTKTSSVSYSRRFPDQNLSISASTNIAQTLRDSSIAVTLPDLNISLSTVFPFKRKHRVGNEKWYEKISMSYSGRMTNSIRTKDDQLFKSSLAKDWRNGIQHSVPISATFNLFKYFNLTPSVSYTERWYARKVKQDWDYDKQEVVRDTVYGFHRVYNYNASLGINTKIYGMYKPIFMKKRNIQIRHVITPTISISAAPDFTTNRYGYYSDYVRVDRAGRRDTVNYSYYANEPFGVPGGGKQGIISLSVSNNLEMKYRNKKDSVKKVSLIDELGASISYNTAAEVRPWSDLSMNIRMKLTKSYTFSMSALFATYAYKFNEKGQVVLSDRTEWSYGRFGRFQGYGTSFSYTLNNQTWGKIVNLFSRKKKKDKANEGDNNEDSHREEKEPKGKSKQTADVDEDGYQIVKMPWSINLSSGFNISENRQREINKKTMRYPYKFSLNALNISGNVKLTNNWAVSFNSGYDFQTKEIVQTSMNITRDLHCFTMTCSLSPFGRWKYYNFSIRANASVLQDLKWEQRSQTQSNVRWY